LSRRAFPDPRHVLVTGASSGIGAALARTYAAPGVRLSLAGRNRARLAHVAEDCRDGGAEVSTVELDVCDAAAMAGWIKEADENLRLDLVIANAGISGGTGGHSEPSDQVRSILAVNCSGVVNTVLPAIEAMRPRRYGQIAIVSSLAGFRGFPGAPAYCASKAMVRVWGEALRGDLAPVGIGVSVICPGYIDTPMTRTNRFPMPFLMSPARAAAICRRGLARNRPRVAFPWPTYFAVWLLALLSPRLTDRLLQLLPAKE